MGPQLKPLPESEQAVGPGFACEAAQEVAISSESQKVLRNTCLVLALTMVTTMIGGFVGMATSGFVLVHPLANTFLMLAGVIGLQYGIAANRDNGLGVALLLLMTGIRHSAQMPGRAVRNAACRESTCPSAATGAFSA